METKAWTSLGEEVPKLIKAALVMQFDDGRTLVFEADDPQAEASMEQADRLPSYMDEFVLPDPDAITVRAGWGPQTAFTLKVKAGPGHILKFRHE